MFHADFSPEIHLHSYQEIVVKKSKPALQQFSVEKWV
jgi:hypothetical protein